MAANFNERNEDVEELITAARLDESELTSFTQSLSMASELSDDMMLIELKPEFLDAIMEGQILTIRGEPGEPAVLCTASKTLEIKEAETSNSLLLLRDLMWSNDSEMSVTAESKIIVPQEVVGIFHTYYELRPSKPKLKKLRTLLEKNLYQGHEYEAENFETKYTFEDLLNCIQASEEELKLALLQIQSCCIGGFWRILDFEYHFRLFSQILQLVDSESWPLDKIPKKSLLDILEDLEPRNILEQCFSWYADDTGHTDATGDHYYSLKENAVCRFYAEVLLRPAEKFNLQEFLESWQKSVPEGMTTSLSQLEGLALTDLRCRPEVIFYFPLYDLPENMNERFNKLFKTKEKWTYEEICPYIRDQTIKGQNVNTLLTKYARASISNGIKVYNSKWPLS